LSGYVLAGVIAGLLLSVVHIVASMQAGRSPSFETAAQLVLSGVGVGTGLKVLKICITADTLQPFSDGDRVYILLGGFALIWLSVSTIVKNVLPKDEQTV
jgi:low affinity Fe/Cu permease